VRVAHSGKLRAQQTAEVLAAALAPAAVLEIMTGLNPNDPVEPVARRVAGWTSDTILVGHLPFMGRLMARLVAGHERGPVAAFVPGSVVCLEQGRGGPLGHHVDGDPRARPALELNQICQHLWRRLPGKTGRGSDEPSHIRAGPRCYCRIVVAPVATRVRRC
jgi:hypothetical protein